MFTLAIGTSFASIPPPRKRGTAIRHGERLRTSQLTIADEARDARLQGITRLAEVSERDED
jgi:hypothetical protein